MYSLNLYLIDNPRITGDSGNFNCITGTLPNGADVSVSRRLAGWTPHIVVAVNGVTLHDNVASKREQASYEALLQRALDLQDTRRCNARALAKQAAVEFFKPSE